MRDQVIVDMFDETALRDEPLDGIMGNGEYDEFERGEMLKLFEKLKADEWCPIDTSKKILDAGCGLGRNIPVLQAAGFTDIEAVDFSPEMLNKFGERFSDVPVNNCDLRDLSIYPDNHFETTFCMYVLIHITDDEAAAKAVSELQRVTRGLLIVGQVMDAENKSQHRICKVREVFEMLDWYKEKKLHHHYKNLYEFHGRNHDWTNRVSFSVFL